MHEKSAESHPPHTLRKINAKGTVTAWGIHTKTHNNNNNYSYTHIHTKPINYLDTKNMNLTN